MTIYGIDTETSSLEDDSRVCEVAAVSVQPPEGGEEQWWVDEWRSTLVNPGVPITPEASAVHHITDEDVRDAPNIEDALSKHIGTMRSPPDMFCAHNAPFDRAKLPQFAGTPWICSWRCSMHLLPGMPSYKLQALRYRLGLKPMLPPELYPHRALYDTIVLAELMRMLLREANPEQLVHLSTQPVLLTKVAFGKHRGQLWADVPKDYLRWMLRMKGDDAFDQDAQHTARYHLGMT